MTQDRIVFNPPALSPECQEHPSLFDLGERVARQRTSATIPSISIEGSASERLLELEVKPQVIARVLSRLSVLEFLLRTTWRSIFGIYTDAIASSQLLAAG